MSSTSKSKSRVRLSRLLSYAGCIRPRADESELVGEKGFQRHVYCNEPHHHVEKGSPLRYCNNSISTTKYSILSFLPKALFEQFRRVANLYFLLCAILALTPLTPYAPYSLIAPLVLVVGVSMIKEAIEDWRRYLADDEVNKRKVLRHVGEGRFEPCEWKAVRVGDVVKVLKDEFFPADLLMLASSYPDGVCYVETMNLDGETNLKLRKALERTLPLEDPEALAKFTAEIKCEDPNPSLYTFVGNLEWDGEATSLTAAQVLLRDSKLRNTAWVVGVVIFTGHDSKVMMNSTAAPSKRSSIERRMDKIIYFLFACLLLMAIVGSIIFGIRTKNQMPSWWYLAPTDTNAYYDPAKPATSSVLQCLTAIILYGYLIPISLYVSIEIVKIFQAWFISADRGMYFAETDMPARARTSNLNEELGQVDTVLSDKTGTLTCNQMDFLKCSIAGVAYGRGITEVERATARRLGRDLSELEDYDEEEERAAAEAAANGTAKPGVKGFALRDNRLLDGAWLREPHREEIRAFLRVLAVCHTVIPEVDEASGQVEYEAESPDEAAFVEAARQMGVAFFKRTQTTVWVREPDETGQNTVDRGVIPPLIISPLIIPPLIIPPLIIPLLIILPPHGTGREYAILAVTAHCGLLYPFTSNREYTILALIEFNSTRKRMSVVVRDPSNRILLMTKGADSVIYERLAPTGRQHLEATRATLHRYGEAGLRTLALAYRELSEEECGEWLERFEGARRSLSAEREALVDAAAEEIEQGLTLLGATAVEDKLQQGVSWVGLGRVSVAPLKPPCAPHPSPPHPARPPCSSLPPFPPPPRPAPPPLCSSSNLGVLFSHSPPQVREAIDRLTQAGIKIWVPEAIDRLAQAGIKIWVLTGDKLETAINIGFACSLLRDDMKQIVVSLDSPDIRKLEDTGDKEKLAAASLVSGVEDRKQWDRVKRLLHDGAALIDRAREGGAPAAGGNANGGDSISNGNGDGGEGDGDGDDEGEGPARVFALVIDGKSLAFALEPELRAALLALAMQCASVVCCRVSPKQKALVTRLVKDGTGRTTLGIGDGANDVGMIHEADIGVGISGVEGQQSLNHPPLFTPPTPAHLSLWQAVIARDLAIAQFKYLERLLLVLALPPCPLPALLPPHNPPATLPSPSPPWQAVMASDFAIAQFKYLERLLLVHGHWSYKRIANAVTFVFYRNVTYFFYKNVAFGLTIFYYNAYAVFSGQIVYNSWACSLYNVFFTSLPVIGYGVLEQDLSDKQLLMVSEGCVGRYGAGWSCVGPCGSNRCSCSQRCTSRDPRTCFFHWTTIAMWIFYGFAQSVLLFWSCLAAVLPQASLPSGKLFEMNGLSATLMTGVVVAVNFQIALITEHWTWITHLFIWGSIGVWYLFLGVYSYFGPDWSTDYYYIFSEVLAPSALYWLTGLLLLPVMAVLPYFVFRGVESRIAPPDQQIVQEIVRLKQDEEAAKAAVAPPLAPVGFTAAVEAVSKRLKKVEKKRRRRGEK
ncbi:unnamed protein product [Closterium sp. Naga37s-1]|nr:unnamed protein product [Closterium sp. Naga37s-1]